MITAQPSTSGGWRDYDFWVFCVSVESCWKIGEGTSRRNRYKNFLQPTKAKNHGILRPTKLPFIIPPNGDVPPSLTAAKFPLSPNGDVQRGVILQT